MQLPSQLQLQLQVTGMVAFTVSAEVPVLFRQGRDHDWILGVWVGMRVRVRVRYVRFSRMRSLGIEPGRVGLWLDALARWTKSHDMLGLS